MGIISKATLSVGAEVSNAVTVSLALLQSDGDALGDKGVVGVYTSSDAAGLIPNTTNLALTAGTHGKKVDVGTTGLVAFVTDAAGLLDVVVTNAANGALTTHLNVVLHTGKIVTSGLLTFVVD